MSRAGILIAVAFAAVLVVGGAFHVLRPLCDGPPTRTQVDVSRLRRIVAAVAAAHELPMKDGVFDPYRLARRGVVARDCFRSERSETGPTDEEIDRGDYANLPWERYRGAPNRKGQATLPLLWEKAPVEWARRDVVALADGSVRCCEREEFLARVLAGLVVQTGRVPTKDGAFDPFQFARDGLVHRGFLRAAFETSPTDAEIDRGDYANFPWERYGAAGSPPFPLLRAMAPDRDGDVPVVMSDGTIRLERPRAE